MMQYDFHTVTCTDVAERQCCGRENLQDHRNMEVKQFLHCGCCANLSGLALDSQDSCLSIAINAAQG